jgi:hypothetical protein
VNLQWHNWNDVATRPAPQILDATLSELAEDPELPTPSTSQVLEWLSRCRALGVHKFEARSLHSSEEDHSAEQLLVELVRRDWDGQGLVFSLQEGCGLPTHLLDRARETQAALEFRWLPLPSQNPDFTTCRRLRDEGCEVSLVVPEAHRLDPICLSRWIQGAVRSDVDVVEIAGRQGAPWSCGIHSLLQFVRGSVPGERPRLAWSSDHGLGLALNQALEAWKAGAQRLRSSLYGCGPRGNLALELLLVNLDLEGCSPESGTLRSLAELCRYGDDEFDLEVPYDYPAFGSDAFRTATGVHAAAIVKAQAMGQSELADLVYSSVAAGKLGLRQQIEVGPMSGKANLIHWLHRNELESDGTTVERMLSQIKRGSQVLTDLELVDLHSEMVKTQGAEARERTFA